jgi:predicted DNA-binding ribbon-helix-helix protein
MKSLVAKRSIVFHGHKTSVSLEDAFWNTCEKETLSSLVSGIDGRRKTGNLSSVLRVFILEFYKEVSDRQARISEESKLAPQ